MSVLLFLWACAQAGWLEGHNRMVPSPFPSCLYRPAVARRALGGNSVSNEPLLLCATGSPSQQRLSDAEPAVDLSLMARLSALDPSRFLYGGKPHLSPGASIPGDPENNSIIS